MSHSDSDEASEKSSEDDHGMMAVSIITVELFRTVTGLCKLHSVYCMT